MSYIEKYGYATCVMMDSPAHRLIQIAAIKLWTEQAILQNQIQFYFDHHSKPVGYVTWAYFTPEVSNRFLYDREFVPHPSEWNEGPELWIIDACFPFGKFRDAFKHIRDTLFPGDAVIHWSRVRKGLRRTSAYCPKLRNYQRLEI